MLRENTINNKICVLPFSHIFVSPQGKYKPCCRFDFKDDLPSFKNIQEAFNSEIWKSLRKQMLSGKKVEACKRCHAEEASGKLSLRQQYNRHPELGESKVSYDNPKMIWLEMPFSNRCNLACSICSSRFSTRWIQDEMTLYGKKFSTVDVFDFPIESLSPLINELVHIKFTGGEPLLDRKNKQVLKLISQTGNCKNIFLNYCTNLTIFPDDETISIWKNLKGIEITLSLDSVLPDEIYYLRYPSNGEAVLENTKKFFALFNEIPQLRLILRSTVSAYNIYSMPETLSYWSQLKKEYAQFEHSIFESPAHLDYPREIDVSVLSLTQKNTVSKKFYSSQDQLPKKLRHFLSYLENYMYSKNDSQITKRFIEFTEKHDQLRNLSAKSIFPHLAYADLV